VDATTSSGEIVPLPQLTDQQRAAALEKAAAVRRTRAEVVARIKRGGTNLSQVLKDAETDEVLGPMKVSTLLEALPKVGKVKAQEIMTELEIAPTRRLKGLGDRQRKALLEKFGYRTGPTDHAPSAKQSSAPASGRVGSPGWRHRATAISLSNAAAQAVRRLLAPAVEVTNDGDDALVRLEIPGLHADQAASVDVDNGVVTVRLRGATTALPAEPTSTPEELATGDDPAAVMAGALDSLTALAAAQLRILEQIDTATAHTRPQHVTLDTPTGSIDYTMPISLDDTYSSTQVSKILSPSGKGHRSIAQNRRRSNKLLAIPIDDNQYRYPKFQVDEARHTIRPIVAYANQILECNEDPWGTLDWWYTEDEGLDDRRPIDVLETGELTEELIDLTVKLSHQAMD
jgi:hypothetical protein